MKLKLTNPLRRTLSYFAVMTALLLACAGCGAQETFDLRLAAAGPYVDGAKAQTYAEQLKLSGENRKASMYAASIPAPAESSGEASAEPNPDAAAAELAGSTNAMKISTMIAAKELDVILCDVQTAARFARSESFYALEELFTEEELGAIPAERRLAYTKLDGEGNPTEELLPACGIDVSGNESLREFIASDQIGVFVVANAADPDLAKAFVLQLAQESA